MENEIKRLKDYNKKKEKFKKQKENTLHNAREFYKGRKMILIAFENNVFPLPKQYPSKNLDDWKEHEMDSTHIISEETDELLPSVKRRRRKTKKEKLFEKVLKKEYHTIDELDKSFFETRRYLGSDLIRKHFN